MEKMSRREAVLVGSPSYFTGEPCVRGHIAPRKTTTGYCRACQRVFTKRWLKAQKVKMKEIMAKAKSQEER